MEIGGGVDEVAEEGGLELGDGGGEAAVDGAVFASGADELLEFGLGVGVVGVLPDVPEAEVGVLGVIGAGGTAERLGGVGVLEGCGASRVSGAARRSARPGMCMATKDPRPWMASYSSCETPVLWKTKSVKSGGVWQAAQLPACAVEPAVGSEVRKILRPASSVAPNWKGWSW